MAPGALPKRSLVTAVTSCFGLMFALMCSAASWNWANATSSCCWRGCRKRLQMWLNCVRTATLMMEKALKRVVPSSRCRLMSNASHCQGAVCSCVKMPLARSRRRRPWNPGEIPRCSALGCSQRIYIDTWERCVRYQTIKQPKNAQNIVTLPKTDMTVEKTTIWRCIPYEKWWCSSQSCSFSGGYICHD